MPNYETRKQFVSLYFTLTEMNWYRSTIPTARALAFSLQSVVALIQSELTARLPKSLTMAALTRLSTMFNDLRSELDALAELCVCVSAWFCTLFERQLEYSG